MQTAVRPHGSENRDQTGFHGFLLPNEFEPKKRKKKHRKGEKEEDDDKEGVAP